MLSACSAFFRRLLRRNPGPNPVIVLWDVAFSDLLNIVDFMYNGEVKVRQANIQSFLAVAEKFRVRGLCQNDSNSSNNGHSGKSTNPDTLIHFASDHKHRIIPVRSTLEDSVLY